MVSSDQFYEKHYDIGRKDVKEFYADWIGTGCHGNLKLFNIKLL